MERCAWVENIPVWLIRKRRKPQIAKCRVWLSTSAKQYLPTTHWVIKRFWPWCWKYIGEFLNIYFIWTRSCWPFLLAPASHQSCHSLAPLPLSWSQTRENIWVPPLWDLRVQDPDPSIVLGPGAAGHNVTKPNICLSKFIFFTGTTK